MISHAAYDNATPAPRRKSLESIAKATTRLRTASKNVVLYCVNGVMVMIEKIARYFETLEGLSTEELDRSVEKLVCAEKRNVALVIMHIVRLTGYAAGIAAEESSD